MRTPMTANRISAFALLIAFVLLPSAQPASAASYDGSWNMLLVTTNGHCGKIKIGLGIDRGRIYSTSGKFVFHKIHLAGRVTASGQAKINGVAGPRVAKGTGRFSRSGGTGTWSGTGPSGVCSGVWSALRS